MFNIRVYGLLINECKQVLVSDEYIRGHYYTKFPGGGLEFGEGTRDCLKREFKEEMDLEVTIGKHIYTTDFFQLSAFSTKQQIMSIYYWVEAVEPIKVSIQKEPFAFDEAQLSLYNNTKEIEAFRYIDWDDFSADQLTLPIDKVVATLVKTTSF